MIEYRSVLLYKKVKLTFLKFEVKKKIETLKAPKNCSFVLSLNIIGGEDGV